MNRRRFHSALLVLAMVVGLPASQWRVDDGAALKMAIRSSVSGDTIVLLGGVYDVNIVLSTSLNLIGAGDGTEVLLRGNGNESVVIVTADSCTIANVVIEQTGRDLLYEHSGVLLLSDHNVVQSSIIRNTLFGIYLKQSNHNRIADNTISSFLDVAQGQRGSGIHIWNSHWNTISGNTISNTRDGIYIQNANNTTITDNEVHSLRYGLHYMYADSNTFLRNSFHDNVAGAAIMYTRHIVMKHNLFFRNRGFASYGVLLQDCHDSVADSNVIVDNVTGIFMESSTNNYCTNNIIAQNDVALQMYQNSEKNIFNGNQFIDNLNLLTLVGKKTDSQWSAHGRGNYWSSYDGYDLDADGIGDIPLRIQNIFNFLEGKNSNVRLYLYSPASQALAMSAKAFPIIDINQEIDPFPLMRPMEMSWAYSMLPTVLQHADAAQPGNASGWNLLFAVTTSAAVTIIYWKRRRVHRASY